MTKRRRFHCKAAPSLPIISELHQAARALGGKVDDATLKVRIWRGDEPRAGSKPTTCRGARTSQTVLDVVTRIQRRLDATLSYRFACRVGMCGSCAMTVNGVARWTCRRLLRKSPRTAV